MQKSKLPSASTIVAQLAKSPPPPSAVSPQENPPKPQESTHKSSIVRHPYASPPHRGKRGAVPIIILAAALALCFVGTLLLLLTYHRATYYQSYCSPEAKYRSLQPCEPQTPLTCEFCHKWKRESKKEVKCPSKYLVEPFVYIQTILLLAHLLLLSTMYRLRRDKLGRRIFFHGGLASCALGVVLLVGPVCFNVFLIAMWDSDAWCKDPKKYSFLPNTMEETKEEFNCEDVNNKIFQHELLVSATILTGLAAILALVGGTDMILLAKRRRVTFAGNMEGMPKDHDEEPMTMEDLVGVMETVSHARSKFLPAAFHQPQAPLQGGARINPNINA